MGNSESRSAEQLAKNLQDPEYVRRMHALGMSSKLNRNTATLETMLPRNNTISKTANAAAVARKRFDTIEARLLALQAIPKEQRSFLQQKEMDDLQLKHLEASEALQKFMLPGLNGGRRKSKRSSTRKASKKSKKSRRNRSNRSNRK